MNKNTLVAGFARFLTNSPTQYHATENMITALVADGFKELKETDSWQIDHNEKYYISKGDGALIAFKTSKTPLTESNPRIVGAHTDSPGLKIKTTPDILFKNYNTLGVEVYGGALLSTWFDRDLSIAGRVTFVGKNDELRSILVDFKRPVAVIPNLAIHLTQNPNEKVKINKQKELPPLFAQVGDQNKKPDFRTLLKKEMKKGSKGLVVKEILDYDLMFYDTQPPTRLGYNKEFFTGGRIDNLLSCYTGLHAFLNAGPDRLTVLVSNDHEEIGSTSTVGAAGPFFESVLKRLILNSEDYYRVIARSILLSADNAHGVHPNYVTQSDANHAPILNGGPAIKINANQRYATSSETGAFFRHICHNHNIPAQTYINHSNLGCGSTIGPISSTRLGVATLDIGVPTFAMHSIRETCGIEDIWYLYQSLKQFYLAD